MKNKWLFWTLLLGCAIPVPFSLISILGSLISFANAPMLAERSVLLYFSALGTMVFSGTYWITYAVSTVFAVKLKRISVFSFLPLMHLCLVGACAYLWDTLGAL